jgi:hypothetical protein
VFFQDNKPKRDVEMTFTAAQRVFLFAGLMTGMVATTSDAADEIRAGKWQFYDRDADARGHPARNGSAGAAA